jgi:hypothetical protein
MDYISVIQHSIGTSVFLKLFKTKEESLFAHIFKSKLLNIELSIFTNVVNFDPERLQTTAVKAYPLNNRPRGNKDISSVKYHQKQIKLKKDITPIWLVYKNNKYILLDGAHRIVASYIENKKYINAYVIIL